MTLFASGESRTKAKLEYVFAEAPSEEIGRTFTELHHLLHCYARQDEFDLINDHTGLMGADRRRRAADAGRAHGARPGRRRPRACSTSRRRRSRPNVGLISISMNQRKPKPGPELDRELPERARLRPLPVRAAPRRLPALRRPHGAGQGRAPRRPHGDGGGPAAEARGKMREPLEIAYFDEFVRPHLTPTIEYLGEVSHGEKVELLQHARATLFPIEWEEPFGLVMIESMACGTPVIATRWGAVPEVIEHGPRRRDRRRLGRRRRRARADRPRSRRSRAAPTPRSASSPSGWWRTTSRPTRRCSRPDRACPSSAAGRATTGPGCRSRRAPRCRRVAGSPARRTNSSCGMPSRTQPAQRSSASCRRARWSGASLSTPKWISARHSGSRRAISSSDACQASTSMSGGGVGGRTYARAAGGCRTRRRPAGRRRGSTRRGAWRGPASGTPPSRRRRRPRAGCWPPGSARAPSRSDRSRRRRAGAPRPRAATGRRGAARRSRTPRRSAPDAAARSTPAAPRGRSGCARAAGAGRRSARASSSRSALLEPRQRRRGPQSWSARPSSVSTR